MTGKLLAYHLKSPRVPLVRVPQFDNHCSKPSLDLFPRKCTYVEVIDLRIMVL